MDGGKWGCHGGMARVKGGSWGVGGGVKGLAEERRQGGHGMAVKNGGGKRGWRILGTGRGGGGQGEV